MFGTKNGRIRYNRHVYIPSTRVVIFTWRTVPGPLVSAHAIQGSSKHPKSKRFLPSQSRNPSSISGTIHPNTHIHTTHQEQRKRTHCTGYDRRCFLSADVARLVPKNHKHTHTATHNGKYRTGASSRITRVALFDANKKPKLFHEQYSLIHTYRRRLLMTGKTRARCKRDKHKHTQKHECIQPRTNVQRSTC